MTSVEQHALSLTKEDAVELLNNGERQLYKKIQDIIVQWRRRGNKLSLDNLRFLSYEVEMIPYRKRR